MRVMATKAENIEYTRNLVMDEILTGEFEQVGTNAVVFEVMDLFGDYRYVEVKFTLKNEDYSPLQEGSKFRQKYGKFRGVAAAFNK